MNENKEGIVKYLKKINPLPDIVAVLISLSALAFSLIYSYAKSEVKDKNLWIYFIIFTLIIALIVFAFNFINTIFITRYKNEKNLEIIEKYNSNLDIVFSMYEKEISRYKNWFYSMRRLSNFEGTVPNDTVIWVISNNLENDSRNELIINTVKNNVKKGIKYKYFYSENEKSKDAADFIKREIGTGVEFIPQKEESFPYPCDILIFNPEYTIVKPLYIFMELVIDEGVNHKAWVRLHNTLAGPIKRFIRSAIDSK